jgi:LacI family transcriptional regulator
VAAHAGVSISTVSRVINDGPYVTERVRTLVLASMQALGYEPHGLAQSLRTGQTKAIGYVVNDIANFLFSAIARGIDDEFQGHGYTMFLANSRSDAQHETALIRHLVRRRVDGLILSLADEHSLELQTQLAQLTIPLVLLDRDIADVQADRVLVDHQRGIAAAVAHLHAFGHRRIGLITGIGSTRPGRAIQEAFAAASRTMGLVLDPDLIQVGPLSEAFGGSALARLLDRPNRPTAILAGGAQISIGVLRGIRQRGLELPAALSLVAYDDTEATELFSPAVTVVARDIYAIGRQAGRLMLNRLSGGQDAPPQTITIPTRLIVRGSTAAP